MADDEPVSPGSPPLPRGTYNINFDELDENTNPFVSHKRLDNSPDRDKNNSNINPFQTKSKLPSTPTDTVNSEENPFQTRSKLSSSPTRETDINEINPFKTKSKLGTSPPKGVTDSEEDPFTTKSKLGSSPPRESVLSDNDKLAANEADNNGASYSEIAESHSDKGLGAGDRSEVIPTPPLPSDDAGEDSQGEKVQDGGADVVEKVPKSKP